MDLQTLKEIVHYDPLTGVFLLLKTTSRQLINKLPYELGQSPNGAGYKEAMILGKTYRLHILAVFYMTGEWPKPGIEVDHEDRNPLNNRWKNLRQLTKMENIRNQSPLKGSTSSGHTGVAFREGKRNPYTAHIRVNKKLIHLGCRKTMEEALSLRREAELKYFTTTHQPKEPT